MTRLEVWGDPIDHSLSPALHRAAYAHLGWDWEYDRRRVGVAEFAAELATARLRGISVTFPLKAAAWAAAGARDRRAELTGAVNTLAFTGAADAPPRGFNTDVGGIVADLRAHGIAAPTSARLVGAGAAGSSGAVSVAVPSAGSSVAAGSGSTATALPSASRALRGIHGAASSAAMLSIRTSARWAAPSMISYTSSSCGAAAISPRRAASSWSISPMRSFAALSPSICTW